MSVIYLHLGAFAQVLVSDLDRQITSKLRGRWHRQSITVTQNWRQN
jgi:hypothetical protein